MNQIKQKIFKLKKGFRVRDLFLLGILLIMLLAVNVVGKVFKKSDLVSKASADFSSGCWTPTAGGGANGGCGCAGSGGSCCGCTGGE